MRLSLLFILMILLASCSNRDGRPDVSDISVNMEMERFENDFFKIDTGNLVASLGELNRKYPRFYPLFINGILLLDQEHQVTKEGNVQLTPAGNAIIMDFLRGYSPIYDSLNEQYNNLNWLKKDIEESFRYVTYYYPKYPVPDLISFIGTFDAPGAILTPKYLGIGLHQFAGRNFSAYHHPEIAQIYPAYISRRFDKEYIPASCMKAVVDDIYPDTTQSGKLLELIIEKGKQWYLLSKFLPDAHDSLVTGFTAAQTKWVNSNEGNIWGSILQNTPDLYTQDLERIQNYLGEGPRTADMPEQSPGNIGQWVGWRIVEKFAETNPDLSVPQVMATPANKLFQEARYKPK